MKKILIIIIMMTISVGVNAATTLGTSGGFDNSGGTSGGFDNSAGTSGGFDNSPGSSGNIMLGGSDGAAGAGLGSSNDPSNGELYRTPSYNPNNGTPPRLSVDGIVMWLIQLLNQLVYLIIGAALVVFLYGILKLSFVDGQKPEAREQSRKFMFWGIVSLFIMVSVWGLVNVLQLTFFGSGTLILPQLR